MGSRAAKGWADSEGGKVPIELDAACSNPLKPVEAASSSSKVCQLLSGNEGESNSAAFDGFMMSKLNPLASEIVKVCLPSGLAVPFPSNVSMPDDEHRLAQFDMSLISATDVWNNGYHRCKGFDCEPVASFVRSWTTST